MDKPIDRFAHAPALAHVAQVDSTRPFTWIRMGWDDLKANPGPSLGHAFLLVALGWVILFVFSTHIDLVAAAMSGFLLVGPMVGAAFYELSRLRAAGQPATFDASLDGALRSGKALARLGLVLALLAIAWAWLSALLFERAFGGDLPSVADNSWQSIFDWDHTGFLAAYLTTGAVLALIAFIVSAVAAPMIFDRKADAKTAMLISIKAVVTNPVAMAVWALSIAVLTAIGFATFLLGLLVVLPVLGHATWHAYRELLG